VRRAFFLVVPLLVLAGCGTTTVTKTVTRDAKLRRGSVMYGHIASLTKTANGYELKFDPAWLLTGTAAEELAFEQNGSRDVPNDSITFDEGHRLLTFGVAPNAQAKVLVGATTSASVPIAKLAEILAGKSGGLKLFGDPKQSGWWIETGFQYPNRVVRLDEQYHP
jgi:hypothetical protein